MIGSIIGAGMQAAGSIFGGIQAAKTAKKIKENIETQKRENQNWYDRRYNEDATQRADAQRLLTMTEESIKKRNKAAAGSAAVMGGTAEAVAAEKAANNAALAEATSQIAAQADARKDSIEAAYQEKEAGFNQQLNQNEAQKAQAISSAVQGLATVGSNIAQLGF
ncbi:MAG: hypothetical protein IKY66_03580 [Bacteroidales bacterium]|nr:hypothetical protein [Bacteroidales bacterium]